MIMKSVVKMKPFFQNECGAVSVEWVFLTAALVGLTILTLSTLETAALEATTDTTTKMSTIGSGG